MLICQSEGKDVNLNIRAALLQYFLRKAYVMFAKCLMCLLPVLPSLLAPNPSRSLSQLNTIDYRVECKKMIGSLSKRFDESVPLPFMAFVTWQDKIKKIFVVFITAILYVCVTAAGM